MRGIILFSFAFLGCWAAAPLSAHTITVDGDAADWLGTPPALIYDSVTPSAGEFIYRGAQFDQRTDPADLAEPNFDLTELRLTADANYLYVLARFRDVTATDEVSLALGLELDNNPSDPNGLIFLGDESGVVFGSVSQQPEYNIQIHNATAGLTTVEVFHDAGGGTWFTPPNTQSFISATNNLLEARIPLGSVGMTSTTVVRVTAVTFDNFVGFNNVIDSTVDYPVVDALDTIGGGTPGVLENAFTRDLNDGDMDLATTLPLTRLTGTATDRDLQLAPLNVSFAPRDVAAGPSEAVGIVLSNTGAFSAINVTSYSLVGPGVGPITFSAPPTLGALAPQTSQTWQVVFDPAAAGTTTASLRIISNDPDTPVVDIPLLGTGLGGGQPARSRNWIRFD